MWWYISYGLQVFETSSWEMGSVFFCCEQDEAVISSGQWSRRRRVMLCDLEVVSLTITQHLPILMGCWPWENQGCLWEVLANQTLPCWRGHEQTLWSIVQPSCQPTASTSCHYARDLHLGHSSPAESQRQLRSYLMSD